VARRRLLLSFSRCFEEILEKERQTSWGEVGEEAIMTSLDFEDIDRETLFRKVMLRGIKLLASCLDVIGR